MPAPTISISEDDLFTVVRSFVLACVAPGVEVIRAQVNLVAPPAGPDWVLMTMVHRNRLSTNIDSWDETNPDASTIQIEQKTQIDTQLDIYGPTSADTASIITTLFRDTWACDFFAATNLEIQPLYSSDAEQMPLVNGEDQYEDRWKIELHLQANLVISTGQQFASTLAVGLINVDVVYPPED